MNIAIGWRIHYIPKNIDVPYLGAAGTWTIVVEDLKTKAAPENVELNPGLNVQPPA